MKQVYATSLLLFGCLTMVNSFSFGQHHGSDNYPEQLKQLLVQLSQETDQPLLKQHFNSVLMVMEEQAHEFPWDAQDTLWVQESLKFFQNEGASWETYSQGPRPLIMSFISPSDGKTSFYWLFLPKNFQSDQEQPLYLELHGSGGGKNDNPRNMLFRALRPELKGVTSQGYRKEGFFLYPWGRGDQWYQGQAQKDILECLDHFDQMFQTDTNRQYLYGFSMGGAGVLSLAQLTVDRWSALGIYSGAFRDGVSAADAQNISQLPVWITWGEEESLAKGNKQLRDLLMAQDAEIKWQEVPGVGHSYLGNYQEDLMDWFKNHTKSEK